MLDIRIVRENPEYVKERVRLRGGDHWMLVDKVLECDVKRRSAETEKQALSQERNSSSKLIGQMMKEGRREEAEELKTRMSEVGDRIKELDAVASAAAEEQEALLLSIPNMPHDAAPVGEDESANPELRVWGTKPEIAEPKDHVELGTSLGLLNFEDSARISGSGFIVYRGLGARLERALINFLLDTQTLENGYQEVGVPFIVKRECMYGTGQLPKFEEDMYGLEENSMFLVPTAEVPVTNLCRDQIFKDADLPIKMTAYTPCFRREAGSHRADERGMVRGHQFNKVEMFQFTTPEGSDEAFEELVKKAENLVAGLGLHFRTVKLAAGDCSASMARTYDIEILIPSMNGYKEVSSVSNARDYQARRGNIRYRRADGKIDFVHTLNGSGLATSRIFPAIVEQNQRADGSIVVPEVLRKYLGGIEVIEKK